MTETAEDSVNYPPAEIVEPTFGKPNYELIILWLLNNNEECTWADFSKVIKKTTLSKYLNKLKTQNHISKSKFNQYRITSKGREKYFELSQDKGGKKLNYPPKIILRKRVYDDLILWMLFNNMSCQWRDFIDTPLSINQSSLSRTLHIMMNKDYIVKKDKDYQITFFGKEEYAQMLRDYDLDIKLKKGLNVVEFTPDKTGTVRWSCWMGMIPGSFVVTEDGQASKEQLASADPGPAGSCGASTGGGCGCGGGCGS